MHKRTGEHWSFHAPFFFSSCPHGLSQTPPSRSGRPLRSETSEATPPNTLHQQRQCARLGDLKENLDRASADGLMVVLETPGKLSMMDR
jgi:hypothetical protein